MAVERTRTPKEEVFWQRLILPEEDKDARWGGYGYRWFRSPNVYALEHYRRRPAEELPPKHDDGQAA
jgi:hypothetical protein